MEYLYIEYEENYKETLAQIMEDEKEKIPETFKLLHALEKEKLSIALKERGNIVSSLVGKFDLKGLYIEYFASYNGYRGRGYGSKLLKYSEALAYKRGCHFVFLETMSFNAPNFYIKKGYNII